MTYGFSYMGFLFLGLLMAPSFYWVTLPGYPQYRARKKWGFAALERIGLTAIFPLALIFQDYNYQGLHPNLIFLILGWSFLVLYYGHWIWCRVRHQLPGRLGKFPLTAFPALAMIFLAIYGTSPWLLLAAMVYGIGHSGGVTAEPQEVPPCPCCSDSSCSVK